MSLFVGVSLLAFFKKRSALKRSTKYCVNEKREKQTHILHLHPKHFSLSFSCSLMSLSFDSVSAQF